MIKIVERRSGWKRSNSKDRVERTTRKIKPNPRYAIVAFVDEPIFIAPSSYEETSKVLSGVRRQRKKLRH